jgi:hypothetical protein
MKIQLTRFPAGCPETRARRREEDYSEAVTWDIRVTDGRCIITTERGTYELEEAGNE